MHPLFAVGLDPQGILEWFGSLAFVGLLAIVFAESGIMIGFVLPGDSLLFVAGLLAYTGTQPDSAALIPNIALVSLGCFIAAAAGDQVGYVFGSRVGSRIFDRPASRLFKPAHLRRSEEFFDKHGPKTIILARFVPIVRTFAPIVAGAGKMHHRTFTAYNLVGAFLWAVGLTQAGYWLGHAFPKLGDNIELAVVAIVALSLVPVTIEIIRNRRRSRASSN